MIPPLQWVFRVTGLFPCGTSGDMFFLLLPVSIYVMFIVMSVYNVIFWNLRNTIAGFDIVNDVVFCVGGIYIVIKTYKYKAYYIDLRECCFNNRSLLKTEIAILFALVSNLVFRFYIKLIKGSLLEFVIYEVTMSFLYSPTAFQILTVCQLKDRFSKINARLRELHEATDIIPLTELKADLTSTFQIHLQLRQLINQVNSYWGVCNAIIFLERVQFLTLVAYYVLISLRNPELYIRTGTFMILGVVVLSIVVQCEVCQRCTAEVSFYNFISLCNTKWCTNFSK